jgi:2-aminoethylphosphonate-pyruvate transaminase
MSFPGWKDNVLFTPGPLTTSRTVKQAMLRDLGSRDHEFIETVREIREGLLAAAGVTAPTFEAILVQGSGTFSVESVLSSTVPPDGQVIVVINGAYGERILKICEVLKIRAVPVRFAENEVPNPDKVRATIAQHAAATHLAIVHCETTTGIMNPLEPFGALAREAKMTFFVDAMSSFGAVPIDFEAAHIDYLVSSANKCIEGVPGFGFVIARREKLEATAGWARSVSLDLLAQLQGLEANGQFRFTPPTHALLAFRQALHELEQEGGVRGRAMRYNHNNTVLAEGMRALGFTEYLNPDLQGYIITSYRCPDVANWNFEMFYNLLNERGYTIYPGKVSDADCFRIGNIGRIFERDIRDLLAAIGEVCTLMGLKLRR